MARKLMLSAEQQRLVTDNNRLAYHVVNRLTKSGRLVCLDYDEACSVAFMALCKAALGFDPKRGIKFSTYACCSIHNNLLREDRERPGVIRTPPVYLSKNERHVERARCVVSLCAFEDKERHVGELGREDRGPPGFEHRTDLKPLLDGLFPRERDVINLVYFRHMTYQEAGERLGISRERVRQLHDRAILRMRGVKAIKKAEKPKRRYNCARCGRRATTFKQFGPLPSLCQGCRVGGLETKN